jgi:hypothetical protein
MTLDEFITEWKGKRQPDFKGFTAKGQAVKGIGGQCVNNIRWYLDSVLGVPQFSGRAYAKHWEKNIPDNFTFIENTPNFIPQKGDIVVWGEKLGNINSEDGQVMGHIAIIIEAELMKFTSFDANFTRKNLCDVVNHSYYAVDGFLRIKGVIAAV